MLQPKRRKSAKSPKVHKNPVPDISTFPSLGSFQCEPSCDPDSCSCRGNRFPTCIAGSVAQDVVRSDNSQTGLIVVKESVPIDPCVAHAAHLAVDVDVKLTVRHDGGVV